MRHLLNVTIFFQRCRSVAVRVFVCADENLEEQGYNYYIGHSEDAVDRGRKAHYIY